MSSRSRRRPRRHLASHGRANCPTCGKNVSVRATGNLWHHSAPSGGYCPASESAVELFTKEPVVVERNTERSFYDEMSPSLPAVFDLPLFPEPTASAQEVADAFGISARAAYDEARRWIESDGTRGLPAIRVGRTVRFLSAPLRRILDGKPATA